MTTDAKADSISCQVYQRMMRKADRDACLPYILPHFPDNQTEDFTFGEVLFFAVFFVVSREILCYNIR